MLSKDLEEKNIRLEERISEFIKLLDNRDSLNQDLVNRNRELKAKLNSHFAITSEFKEDESFLIIGLELLLLIKKHRYNQLKNETHWLLLYVSYRPTPSINLHQSFLSLSQNKDHGILDIRLFQNPLQRIHRFGR